MRSFRSSGKELELSRFCIAQGINVVGGFSKILPHLPKPIVTYSDNRVSDGKLYEVNGFKFDGFVKPTYEFMKNGERLSKRSLEAKVGTNDTQVYTSNGYYTLYDAGKKRWALT